MNTEQLKPNKVLFGLEAQGHIKTIEDYFARFEDKELMMYDCNAWSAISEKIGWSPFGAAMAYFKYLKEANNNAESMAVDVETIAKIGDTVIHSRYGNKNAPIGSSERSYWETQINGFVEGYNYALANKPQPLINK